MVYLLILSALLDVLYTGTAIWAKRGMPDSISSMVYLLPKTGQWVWTLWVWAVTMLMAPALLEAMPDGLHFIAFLTVASLMFCGAMPVVKHERNTAHNIFGVSAGILSQVCVLFIGPWWLLAWLLMTAMLFGSLAAFNDSVLTPRICDGKGVFVSEAICGVSTMGSLFCFFV